MQSYQALPNDISGISDAEQGKIDGHTLLDEAEYEPILKSKPASLLGLCEIDPWKWAIIQLLSDLIGVVSFAVSIHHNHKEYFYFILLYVFSSYVAAPIWQNFTLEAGPSRTVSCHYGCILCVGINNFFALLSNKITLLPRRDDETPESRFIPFSAYNSVFAILNPGFELNPQLPHQRMDGFGVGRTLLLTYSASAKGGYNLIVFYYTLRMFNEEAEPYIKVAAFISLIMALADLRVYLLSSAFGAIFYPYLAMLHIALYCPMCSFVLNPPQGSCLFRVLQFYWQVIITYGM
jgi:hypothetical protein